MLATTARSGLRAPLGWRAGFALAAMFFLSAFLGNVVAALATATAWGFGHVVLVLLTALGAVTSMYAAACAACNRVWYDEATNTLRQRSVFFEEERALHRPTTVTFTHRPAVLVPDGLWEITVRSHGQRPLVLRTPWVGTAEDVARMLRPAFHRNLDLPGDALSRRALVDPGSLTSTAEPRSDHPCAGAHS